MITDTGLKKLAKLNMKLGFWTPKISEFCFIIGAMKSGTTTLYEYLSQHPAFARNYFSKESEFFSKYEPPSNLKPYFRQWFPRPLRRQIALEASTCYSKMPAFPDVARRLTKLPGRKHFVYILRHPVERLESHIAHNIAAGELRPPPDGALPDLTHHLAVSRYAEQLDAYRSAFPEIPVITVAFERLKSDPTRVIREIFTRLDVDPHITLRELPPLNARPKEGAATAFRLTDAQRSDVAEALRADVRRLHDAYGFDVSVWGLK